MNLDRTLGTMFMLIFVFIVVSRADETSRLLSAMGSFITDQTRALQGVGYTGNFEVIRGR